jgi:trichothecene 3-O-acetyltransferase
MAEIHIPLTPMDHTVPKAYYQGAFYLPLKSDVNPTEAFDLLHEALHRTFAHLPWLSGRVYPQARKTFGWRPGQIEIRHEHVDIKGARPYQFKFKQLDDFISYEELKDSGFPVDTFSVRND